MGYHSQIILNGRKVNDSMGVFVADAAIKQMIEAGLAPKKLMLLFWESHLKKIVQTLAIVKL